MNPRPTVFGVIDRIDRLNHIAGIDISSCDTVVLEERIPGTVGAVVEGGRVAVIRRSADGRSRPGRQARLRSTTGRLRRQALPETWRSQAPTPVRESRFRSNCFPVPGMPQEACSGFECSGCQGSGGFPYRRRRLPR